MKPITTEKAVMNIEAQNVLTFEVEKQKIKSEVKKEIEEMFNVKVAKVNSQIRGNKKIVYAQLNKENPAIDVATKLGVI